MRHYPFTTTLAPSVVILLIGATADAQCMFVSSGGTNSVIEYDAATGGFIRIFVPSGSGGLLSTIDDFHLFGRWMLNKGRFGDQQLLSIASVERMTTNHLTPEQIAGAGFLLNGEGWGYGMAVAVNPDDVSSQPGRYGWSGGYGTAWFNDPQRDLTAIALTQTVEFLFAGGLTEFEKLAMEA